MHIHIPDGVLPIWLWVLGFAITLVFLSISAIRLKSDLRRMPLAAILTALVVLLMSVPLGIPAHINMMVFVGIIMGIHWSLVISFLVNFILASFAHGGLSIIGLNTLILWAQAIIGIALFGVLKQLLKDKSLRGGLTTFLAILLSFFLTLGIVLAANLEVDKFFFDDHDHYEEKYYDEEHHDEISLLIFLSLSLPFVLWGAAIESIVTFVGIKHIDKTRPELIK
ncbi:MAG: energy-coupling factor ABC transporter permease [Candidatus Nealsonbacteria bacterium]|nr:energy-coupling factor ABC transporter permease [Candidatus Nealsonbacteria bacterium]